MSEDKYTTDSEFGPCPVCEGPSRYTMLGGIQCADKGSECPVFPVVFGDDDDIEGKWALLCRLVRAGRRTIERKVDWVDVEFSDRTHEPGDKEAGTMRGEIQFHLDDAATEPE